MRGVWGIFAPHPSPLPEVEGTDRGVLSSYADLKYRGELRLENYTNLLPFPLGGEGWGEGVSF
ncbi:hypothetical protein EMIT093MI4_150024 [Pseudomonas sp. IT-93MI4]